MPMLIVYRTPILVRLYNRNVISAGIRHQIRNKTQIASPPISNVGLGVRQTADHSATPKDGTNSALRTNSLDSLRFALGQGRR